MSKLVIFTGAGISAESDIPTFRDNDGVWEKYDLNVVCNFDTWKDNYNIVHAFYNKRRHDINNAKPNAAHHQIAKWQKQYNIKIITQNIDNLLELAGCHDVLHVHGNIHKMKCSECHAEYDIVNDWVGNCRYCSGYVKPDIVFFNEMAPKYEDMFAILNNIDVDDVLLVMGTSGQVIDIGTYARHGDFVSILSNFETSSEKYQIQDSDFDYVFHGKATQKIFEIDALLKRIMQ